MSKKNITVNYRGQVCTVQKIDVYCKAGAYEHKYKTGWGLVNLAGEVLAGGERENQTNTKCWGAARHEHPCYQTRKCLIESLYWIGAEPMDEHTRRVMQRHHIP
jgi:hypothetical protein